MMLLRRLTTIVAELRACDAGIGKILDDLVTAGGNSVSQKNQQRDVVLQSLPGVGSTILAALRTEAHEALQNRDYHGLRLLSGIAPVTRRTGKQLLVSRRLACNRRLAAATYHWA